MKPLQLTPLLVFDHTKHMIDTVAQKYLEQASKSIQHLTPIKIMTDGNCLFNSIVSLTPNFGISSVELRGSFHPLYIVGKNILKQFAFCF